jgi:hypothetical protein
MQAGGQQERAALPAGPIQKGNIAWTCQARMADLPMAWRWIQFVMSLAGQNGVEWLA